MKFLMEKATEYDDEGNLIKYKGFIVGENVIVKNVKYTNGRPAVAKLIGFYDGRDRLSNGISAEIKWYNKDKLASDTLRNGWHAADRPDYFPSIWELDHYDRATYRVKYLNNAVLNRISAIAELFDGEYSSAYSDSENIAYKFMDVDDAKDFIRKLSREYNSVKVEFIPEEDKPETSFTEYNQYVYVNKASLFNNTDETI